MYIFDYHFVMKYFVIARWDMSEPKQSITYLLSKKIASLLRKALLQFAMTKLRPKTHIKVNKPDTNGNKIDCFAR